MNKFILIFSIVLLWCVIGYAQIKSEESYLKSAPFKMETVVQPAGVPKQLFQLLVYLKCL